MALFIPERVAERAYKNADRVGDCWISRYSTGSHGYAQVGWVPQTGSRISATTAHRAAWVYVKGEQIPDGMTIDHTCKNRRCVNVDHMRLLTNFENARRTHGRDWPLGECARGHSNEHLVDLARGRKACGICASSNYNRSAVSA